MFRGFLEVFRGFRGFQRFFRDFQRFSEVLSETLSEVDFPLRGSQSCFPLIVLPFELSLQIWWHCSGYLCHDGYRWCAKEKP